MKIIINKCYGGFGLSKAATLAYCEAKQIKVWHEKQGEYDQYWLVPPEERLVIANDFYSLPMDERIEFNKRCASQRFYDTSISRTDPALIEIVERLGEEADGKFGELKIIEIPNDVIWEIEEYDGTEWVAEVHRTWL